MKPKRTMSRSAFMNSSNGYSSKSFYETDDDRDSGTESDDEGAEIEELQKYMESIIHLDSRNSVDHRRGRRPHPPPSQQVTSGEEGQTDPPPPRHHRQQPHHQHHRPRRRPNGTTNPRRSPDDAALDSALPSDSDLNLEHHSSEEELEVINGHPPPEKRKWGGGGSAEDGTEDEPIFCCRPVQFRTSPPAHAHKPGKCLRQADIPPHELCSVSPRKRHRRTPTAIQRPCLDFEKMQQGLVKNFNFLGNGERCRRFPSNCFSFVSFDGLNIEVQANFY